MRFFKRDFLTVLLLTVLTASCAVQTKPTSLGERAARATTDKEALFREQEEVARPITLYEAMARAIKYNSDQRVALMEQAIASGAADFASIDLLPKIAAEGGFSSRSKELAVSAESVETQRETLEPSYVENKNVRKAGLHMVYNVLDFGISYVNAKQASDRRYISEELRRKSIHQVIHDVRSAFWKAAAAQRIAEDLGVLISSVHEELVRINTVDIKEKTKEQLEEQKKLLTALQSLIDLRGDILTAKAELGALMNLPPNIEFTLDIPNEMDRKNIVKDFGQIDLEHFALVNRPELRINDYEARIAEAEAKKEILRLFPGIEFDAGINYNSNSYLKNKSWTDAGIGVTWNLMRLFTQPKAIELAKDKQELERLRRLAMTMAVTTQVRISSLQLRQAAENFEVVNSLDNVNAALWQKAFAGKNKTETERRQTLLSAVERLISRLKRDFAYAEYKEAESRLFVALGIDPLPRFIAQANIPALSEMLEDNLSRNAPQGFKEVSYDQPLPTRPNFSALSEDQRARLLSWTDLRRTEKAVPPAWDSTEALKKKQDGGFARKAPPKRKTYSDAMKLLQMSSFENLDGAQTYWRQLTETNGALRSYSPIFREVELPGIGTRFRTFIADTEDRLEEICRRLATELKSCLIINQ